MAEPSRASALRNGYLVQHRAMNLALRARDAWLRSRGSRAPVGTVAVPRRLLVCVGGHLGDAVLATSVLPTLQSAYPDAEIGVLAPSWARPVFEGHPAIRWLHALDHWKTNRAGTALRRWAANRRTAARARKEIRQVRYDTAIDLYPFFPNASALLADAAIPTRIGYTSGGGGPLYTHAVPWADTTRHTVEQHDMLLRAFLPDVPPGAPRYDLPPLGRAECARGRATLSKLSIAEGSYVIMHPGVGDWRKRWPAHHWRALVARLRRHDAGLAVVFTGHGDADAALIDDIRDHDDSLISRCGCTSWGELRYLLANASLVVGVDSVAAHLAAAHDVPCIAIMAAMSDPAHWRPLGSRVRVLTNAVPCAPCFRSKGCATMSCVRGVSVDAVEGAAVALLDPTEATTR
ncbi:MAG TPA: glycosyltransferase family 9 protein [Gemmatimonadaceae bacterium]|nr:glycosyltransferase family 9 protein [Gemmatimonadaceae bacterium]